MAKVDFEKYLGELEWNGDNAFVFSVLADSSGQVIPQSEQPGETYDDESVFWQIGFNEELEQGDVLLFKVGENGSGKIHPAIYLETRENGYLLLHYTPESGPKIWTMQNLTEESKYKEIVGVRRLINHEQYDYYAG
jgi:hypothetical protein